jgi:hypothetical protein
VSDMGGSLFWALGAPRSAFGNVVLSGA